MPRLYQELAHLWPLLSPPQDYTADAEKIRALIDQKLGNPQSAKRFAILELGAGGGHTLCHLSNDFDCTAVDLSDAMLDNSRKLNPNVEHIVADMRCFDLHRTFDVVLIHDAVDYLLTENDIAATFAAVHRHLRPGGVAIIAPTYVSESFCDGESTEDENANEQVELRYVSQVERVPGQPNQIAMNLTLFQRDRTTQQMTIESDRHLCGLFPKQTWLDLMSAENFNVEMHTLLVDQAGHDDPIPTFVGVKN